MLDPLGPWLFDELDFLIPLPEFLERTAGPSDGGLKQSALTDSYKDWGFFKEEEATPGEGCWST